MKPKVGDNAPSFKSFLRDQRIFDTPEGDFLLDALRDASFPETKSWPVVMAHLRSCGASSEAIRAAAHVFQRFERHAKMRRAGAEQGLGSADRQSGVVPSGLTPDDPQRAP